MIPTGLSVARTLIERWEGCRLSAPYKDTRGVWTIGTGFTTWQGVAVTGWLPASITQSECDAYLETLLAHFRDGVTEAITGTTLNAGQLGACISLSYNIGLYAFRASTVARKLNCKDLLGAGDAFLMWDMAGGRPSEGLLNRRRDERRVFLGGQPV